MKGLDGLLLTFLLNALWQIPAVVGAGLLGSLLLRRAPARQRHALWLVVAVSCLALPTASLWRPGHAASPPVVSASAPQPTGAVAAPAGPLPRPARYAPATGAAVMAGCALLLLFRGVRLGRTWRRTLGLARRARPLEVPQGTVPLIARCRRALGVGPWPSSSPKK